MLKLHVLASVPVHMHSKNAEFSFYVRPHEVLKVFFCWDLPEQITMRLVKSVMTRKLTSMDGKLLHSAPRHLMKLLFRGSKLGLIVRKLCFTELIPISQCHT